MAYSELVKNFDRIRPLDKIQDYDVSPKWYKSELLNIAEGIKYIREN